LRSSLIPMTGCSGRAASGHEAADPAITLMKSRRRIAVPKGLDYAEWDGLQQVFVADEMGFRRQVAQQQF
jgi:hypothetical protein